MTAFIIALALSARDPLPHVDVCEINNTPTIRQIILYRWTWLPGGRSHHVAQWWSVGVDPIVERRGDIWMISSEGRRFTCRTLRRTETPYDPEVLDRKKLNEADRNPYICLPH
jgi:hypothetical protein